MPILGSHLNFAQLEARSMRIHNLTTPPSSPVTGQLYYDTVANTLYFYNGTAWVSASGGAPSDATTTTKGVVQLAGDLAGTAAAPVVATGAITSAKILDGTITDVDVAGANKDGVVGLASMRTLGLGAQQAMPGNEPLNLITAPAGDVSFNTHKATNLVDPTNGQDAATKTYVDNSVQGLDAKASVHAATVGANITLAGSAPSTLDGVTLVANDRVLVKDQTTPAQNGIYVVATLGTGVNGTWVRANDFNTWSQVPSAYVFVESGTVNADTGWVSTADAGGSIGTTSVTWVQFSSAGAAIAGNGLTKTGNTIDVGPGTGISVAADTVSVNGAIIPRFYDNGAVHGAGTTITITQATHGCRASRGLIVQVHDTTTGGQELPDISVASNGDVTVTYAVALTANTKQVTIVG